MPAQTLGPLRAVRPLGVGPLLPGCLRERLQGVADIFREEELPSHEQAREASRAGAVARARNPDRQRFLLLQHLSSLLELAYNDPTFKYDDDTEADLSLEPLRSTHAAASWRFFG